MKKRILALMLSTGMILGLFAGCGTPTTPEAPADGVTNLEFWGDWTGEGEDWMNEMINAFEAENKDINIEYIPQPEILDVLVTSIAGGKTPDILFWDRYLTGTYARKGYLYAIDDLVKQNNVDLTKLVPGGVEEMTIEGKLYGLPMIVDTRGYVINKADFAKAGVAVPKTWDDYIAAGDKVSAATGKKFMATGEQLGLFATLLQAGGYPIDEAGNLKYDNEAGLATLGFYETMLKKGQLEITDKDIMPTFTQGTVSVAPVISANIANLKDFAGEGFEYEFVAPPTGPNGDTGAMLGGYGLAIPAKSANAEAAFRFINWWAMNAENSKIFCDLSGELPANLELLNSETYAADPDFAPFIEALTYARPRPTEIWWDEVEKKIIKPAVETFMDGKLTAKETVEKIDKEGNALIATIK